MADTERRKRILVIDPDPYLGEIRKIVLQSHGFEAEWAKSGNDHLSNWAPRKYDLVVVEVQSDAEAALSFCNELKGKDSAQLVALMSNHHVWIPPHPCPDAVIARSEGPAQFVNRIKILLEQPPSA
jgi:DNA-binding NtrC family response regulator